ncbi:MAG: hypothetical protein RTU30_02355 [Candidatus Thorarchaeota archaeon]
MSILTLTELGSEGIERILTSAEGYLSDGYGVLADSSTSKPAIGIMLHGSPDYEREIAKLVAAKSDWNLVELDLNLGESIDEILSRIEMVSSSVDTLLTSIIDYNTFGAGRELTEMIAKQSNSPLVNIRDDIYGNLPGLSALLAIKRRLGTLSGKRIAVSWAFGSQFVLPSTAHTLVLSSAMIGVDVKIVAPNKFPLMRRVVREAGTFSQVETVDTFEGAFQGVDAVIPINWCRIDDFMHPERNREHALEYRDWFLEESNIEGSTLVVTEPPIQYDLSMSREIAVSSRNLTRDWYNLRISTLAATAFLASRKSADEPISLV